MAWEPPRFWSQNVGNCGLDPRQEVTFCRADNWFLGHPEAFFVNNRAAYYFVPSEGRWKDGLKRLSIGIGGIYCYSYMFRASYASWTNKTWRANTNVFSCVPRSAWDWKQLLTLNLTLAPWPIAGDLLSSTRTAQVKEIGMDCKFMQIPLIFIGRHSHYVGAGFYGKVCWHSLILFARLALYIYIYIHKSNLSKTLALVLSSRLHVLRAAGRHWF